MVATGRVEMAGFKPNGFGGESRSLESEGEGYSGTPWQQAPEFFYALTGGAVS
jgi:hypothetical protein